MVVSSPVDMVKIVLCLFSLSFKHVRESEMEIQTLLDRVFLQKSLTAQSIKTFPSLQGSPNFIATFITYRQLLCPKSEQSLSYGLHAPPIPFAFFFFFFDRPVNVFWRVKIMNLFIMLRFPFPRYLTRLTPRHLSKHCVFGYLTQRE